MKLRVKANLFIFLGFILFAIAAFNNQTRAFSPINSHHIIPVAIAIADQNSDLIPDKLGDTVSVAGRVSVSSGVFWKDRLQIAIQDNTGSIEIYERDYSGTRISMGDSMQVTGIIGQYRGQTQLTHIHVNFIDSLNRKIPQPVLYVKGHPETYEGRIVTLKGRIINKSSNAGGDYLIVSLVSGSGSSFMVFNSKNHKYPNLLKKFTIGESLKITGLFAHYTDNKNSNKNYQLLPRSENDLEIVEYSSQFYIYSVAGIAGIAILMLLFNLVLSRRVRQKTKNLKESEQRFATLAEATTSAILIYQNDELVYFNNSAGKLANDTAPNLFYGNFANLVKSYEEKIYSETSAGKVIRAEISLKSSDNEMIWLDYTLSTFLWGNKDAVIITTTDITTRKEAEESLSKFKMGIENSTDAIFITDKNGIIESINTAFEKIYGYTATEVIGQTPRIIKSGLLSQSDYEYFWNTLLAKKAAVGEIVNKTKDGQFVTIDGSNTPILDETGELIGFISINRDITERKKTENDLKESEEKFRKLAENTTMAICIYQDDFWVYINPAGEKLSGYSLEELYQSKYWEFVAPEYQEQIRNNGKNRQAGEGENNAYEFRIITKTGESRWVVLTGTTITYKERPAGIITVVDITEWKKAEVELLDASHKMNAFFEQSLDGFFFMTMDRPIEWNDKADKEQLLEFIFSNLKITRINDAMLTQYGADLDQFLGITPNDFFVHDIEQGKNVFRKILDNGKSHTETDERKLNGEPIFVEGDYTCLYDSEGRMTGLFGIQRDITESKKMTGMLRESENKYRYLFDNNPAPMWIYDIETLSFLEVNDTAIIQYGYSREEFMCMTLKNIRPEEDVNALLKDIEQTANPFNKAGTWRHIKKNGDIIFVEIASHQLEFEGRLARMVLINDVSERKKAEDALVESENSLKQAQIIANLGDWEFDFIQNKTKWSDNCFRIYDLQPNEIEPSYEYFRSRVHPDDLKQVDDGYTTILQTKLPVEQEIRITFPDKRIKWILNKIIPTFHENEIIHMKGVNVDITEKKNAEEQLRLLSTSIEQSPVSMVITDANGTIGYINNSFTKTTGYTKGEALGKNPRVLKSGIHDASFYEDMWKILLSGQPWIGEIQNRKKNGELYWENAIISPILNTNGKITHFSAAKEDITEKKKLFSDLITAKEKAEESDRLKSAFLANMSHEVRTPLNSIIGFSELLAEPDFDDEQKNEFIHLIVTNGNNLLTIISDIMDISKLESGELKIYNKRINTSIYISNLKAQFAFQIEAKGLEFIVLNPSTHENISIFADGDRLNQVFNNLLSNALKFTSNGSIEIGYQPKGEMVEFYVKDSGIGIPLEYYKNIFDRFRQVEDEKTRKYGGNGLGLAITKNLIELMGGKIWLESEPGKGSVFYFTMPCEDMPKSVG